MIAGVWDPRAGALLRRLRAPVLADGPLAVGGGEAARDGDVRVVLHGELRAPAGAGARWVAGAVRAAGLGGLRDARGSFVVAVWDGRRLLVARDHLGEEGLWWAHADGGVAFAAETEALLALLPARPAPDVAAVAGWLATTRLHGGASWWRGVTRLPPGGALEAGPDGVRVLRWWTPGPAPAAAAGARRPQAAALARDVVTSAVQRCVPADGGAALLLSGGLDSSAIAALAARDGRPLAAYAMHFPRFGALDERRFVDALGLPATRMVVQGGSALRGLLEWTAHFRAPLLAPGAFYQAPLSRRIAADGHGAVLDGEGGDEAFGVVRARLGDLLRAGRPDAALRLARRHPGAGRRPPLRPLLAVLRAAALDAAPRAVRTRVARRSLPVAVPWLRRDLAAAAAATAAEHAWWRADGPRWEAWLRWALGDGLDELGAHEHFRRRAALGGLRARHPLHDVDVVQLALALPPEVHWDPWLDRPVLRDALAGTLDDAIRLRRGKAVFDPLIGDSLAVRDRAALEVLLGEPDAPVRAFLAPGALDALLAEPPSASWGDRAFRLAAMECWLRTEADPAWPALALERLAPGGAELAFEPPG